MKPIYAAAGGIVTALLAASCCIGPLLFLLFGITGLGFLASIAWFRPYLLGITAALCFVSYRYAYGKGADCADNGRCGLRTMRIKKVLFWVLIAFALFGVGFPYVAQWLV